MLRGIDWTLAGAIIATCILWGIAGYELGRYRHGGLEEDRPTVRDLVPLPPAPVVVPDMTVSWDPDGSPPLYIPDDWKADR